VAADRTKRLILVTGSLGLFLCLAVAIITLFSSDLRAAGPWRTWRHEKSCDSVCVSDDSFPEMGGTWYWLRSPDEEKRVVIGLYNRNCVRCHGVDGRGVWDIPDVPDFTNTRWQASRSDAQLVRLTLEGRGAVMPPFRGALTLEEAWAMARYLRTFVPGTGVSRPDLGPQPKKIDITPK